MNDKDPSVCKRVRDSIPGYLEGNLDESRNHETEKHLKECDECAEILEREENKAFVVGNGDAETYDIKKIELRFARRIFGKFLTTATILLLAGYIVFTVILPLLFSKSTMEKSEYARYALDDLMQFTIPGAVIGNTPNSGHTGIFNLYSLAEFKKPLAGGGEKTGRFDLAIPAYIGKSDLKTEWSREGDGSDVTFRFPQSADMNSLDQQWGKLDRLKNGTRCRIATYFERPLTLKETEAVLNLVNAEDLNTWLAIDTGNNENDRLLRGLFYDIEWGFPMGLRLTPATADKIIRDEKGNTTGMSSSYPEHSVSTIAEKFKKEMKDFEKYSTVLGIDDFREELIAANQYLASNEIKVKGTVLGASTVDMLKLRDYPGLARIDILKVDFDY